MHSTKYYQLYSYGDFNRIIVELVEKAKTGKCLAEEIGKTPCAVSKWCSNSIQPILQTLNDIADLLKLDVKDLIVSNNYSFEK